MASIVSQWCHVHLSFYSAYNTVAFCISSLVRSLGGGGGVGELKRVMNTVGVCIGLYNNTKTQR